MRTQTRFSRVLAEIDHAKHEADDDAVAEMADKAWTNTLVAERHAMLVGRFMDLSAAERQLAARLSAQPGRQMLAEAARVRASRYYDIAERHRKASEEREKEGAQMANEVRSKQKQKSGDGQRPQPQQPQRPRPRQEPPQQPQHPPQRTAPARPAAPNIASAGMPPVGAPPPEHSGQ